ncbi:MAG: prepilin-type N-terminal cleavage/methylation domain-containing protein [Patescibacteria group bacterium]
MFKKLRNYPPQLALFAREASRAVFGEAGKLQTNKGFSIIETVVALSIITIGILGILSLFTQTVSNSELGVNQEIATNLAQEGVEIIRNQRDSNWITEKEEWDDGISEIGYYQVNFKDNNTWEIKKLGIDSTFQPFYLKNDEIYTHDATGKITIFSRQIAIKNDEKDILKITSTVQWTERGKTQSIILKDNLYNWQ